MSIQESQHSGLRIDDYVLGSMIGEGSFSWLYKATSEDGLGTRVFKIAKPADLPPPPQTESFSTQALTYRTGSIGAITPDPSQLLGLQGQKLMAAKDPAVVSVDQCIVDDALSYCRMEMINGKTLRSIMNAGPVPVTVFGALAEALERLSSNPDFEYHGDLKPENIMVTEGGIKLIDPGYTGPLDCREGNLDLCLVTTPEYYPLLAVKDDLFALGIIMWEAACRKHPLSEGGESCYADLRRIGKDLHNWVRYKELVGQFYLSPILSAGLPSEVRPGLPPAVENILMKGLQLQLTPTGKIDKGPGYKGFGELIEDLKGLMAQNIRQL